MPGVWNAKGRLKSVPFTLNTLDNASVASAPRVSGIEHYFSTLKTLDF